MANRVFLGLGSNKGDRLDYLRRATGFIESNGKCRVIGVSSVYETTPYGPIEQENYYNAVAEIETGMNLNDLHNFVKDSEIKIGRGSGEVKWGPREIDIDILFYNNLIYKSDLLKVPHNEILQRDFVIIPLVEIAPGFIHPEMKQELGKIDLSKIKKHIVRKLDLQIK